MIKRLITCVFALMPYAVLADSDNLIVAKHPTAKTVASTQYAYVPMEVLMDSKGSQFKTLAGQYKSYVQELSNQSALSYSHYIEDLATQLKTQGFTIAAQCITNCSTKPYSKKIANSFRYNNIYQVNYTNARKNSFGYLAATKGVDGQQQAIQVFAQNGHRNTLKFAYEQIVETPMPDSGVVVKNDFAVKPLDFSSLKAPKRDVKGASDHPMIERFPGSYIAATAVNDFESYPLIIGQYKKSIPTKQVSGKITTVNYRIDAKVGPYAVHKNYINALQQAGFTIIFECSAPTCGNYILRDNLKNTIHAKNHKSDIYNMNRKRHYYLFSAEKVTPAGKVYATMYSYQNSGKYAVEMVVDVIEERAVSKVALNIDSDTLGKQIQATGSVSLYGIEFDFDKHTLKASSNKQLAEIADFLKKSNKVSLYVVGHTDNKGQFEYNQNLSKRRAAEVVNTLVSQYQIDSKRLAAVGVGPVAPKAANDTESNRQQNRRVELVLKSPLSL
ncbi:OmpA family protein [Psychrobium sp. 1_MG-2023]|uniref:OmpA family protein n=1 Tax=Psychrobium sp. 1_MG-2023 TaxID=3062624 RepID=UPI000C34502C|nr:OmpA family protein [Psychrobium sp. 1_MG-2023]MDP2562603.1 OmpA family protein [Psychrobium sp. 1_MG-2023]PKF59633.1 hypothetical protein CW748_00015 [Alteromonadales bacterium alter-6D02]